MRLFTGIEPAAAVIENLRPLLAKIKSVPEANLHITTKFIGEWPEARLEELKDALSCMKPPSRFDVKVAGLTFLAKALCAEIEAGPELPELARVANETLETLGCTHETRPYLPHLTLARPKHENIGELRRMVSQMGKPDFGSFEVTEFHLYLSRASVYTKLATWQLT